MTLLEEAIRAVDHARFNKMSERQFRVEYLDLAPGLFGKLLYECVNGDNWRNKVEAMFNKHGVAWSIQREAWNRRQQK